MASLLRKCCCNGTTPPGCTRILTPCAAPEDYLGPPHMYVDGFAWASAGSPPVIRFGYWCYTVGDCAETLPGDANVLNSFINATSCEDCEGTFPCNPDPDEEATDEEIESTYPDVAGAIRGVSWCDCYDWQNPVAGSTKVESSGLNGTFVLLDAAPVSRRFAGHCRTYTYDTAALGRTVATSSFATTCDGEVYQVLDQDRLLLVLRLCCDAVADLPVWTYETGGGTYPVTYDVGIAGGINNVAAYTDTWDGGGGVLVVAANGLHTDGNCKYDGPPTDPNDEAAMGGGGVVFFAIPPGI